MALEAPQSELHRASFVAQKRSRNSRAAVDHVVCLLGIRQNRRPRMLPQDPPPPAVDKEVLSRRHFLSNSAVALAATVAAAPLAATAQQAQNSVPARPAGVQVTSPDHHLPNEKLAFASFTGMYRRSGPSSSTAKPASPPSTPPPTAKASSTTSAPAISGSSPEAHLIPSRDSAPMAACSFSSSTTAASTSSTPSS